MITIAAIAGLALAAAAGVFLRGLHRQRSVEDMIGAIAIVTEPTRVAIEELGPCLIRRQRSVIHSGRDLLVFWWNSRLFVRISNELAAGVESIEVKAAAERISTHHKQLVRLLAIACWERAMEKGFRMTLGEYQADFAACYLEESDLLRYLITYWRPDSQEILGARI